MTDFILSSDNIPFTVAIVFMLFIALLEGVTTVLGMGLSSFLDSLFPDSDLDADIETDAVDLDTGSSVLTRFLAWIQIGKAPLLVILIIGLTAFGILGYLIQSIIKFFLGFFLPWFIAVIPAFILTMPLLRMSVKILSKIMPEDETSAVSQDSFIGQIAIITLGKAEKGKPAEAKLKDKFGQTHYLMVEPDLDSETFRQSEQVLLVKRAGSIYKAIKNTNVLLADN